MKVANAPSVLLYQDVRKETEDSLKGGETVLLKGAAEHPAEAVAFKEFSPEVTRAILSGSSAITALKVNQAAHVELNKQGMMVGSGTGTVIGLGVGILLQQLRQVHPTSALALDAACALIGGGLGAAVGSGQFEVEPAWDGKSWSMRVRSTAVKAV